MTEDLIMYDQVDYEYLKKGITYFDSDERLLKFSLHFYPGNQNELTPSPNPVGANNIITPYSYDNDFVQWNFGYPGFGIAFYKTLQFYESLVRIKDYYNDINNNTWFSPHQWEKYPWHIRHADMIRESTLVCKKKVIYPCVDFVRSDAQINKIGKYHWRKWEAFHIPDDVSILFNEYCIKYESLIFGKD